MRLYRLTIFAIAAMFAGGGGRLIRQLLQVPLAGLIQAHRSRILFLIIVAVGGLGNVYGALVGSVAIVLLTEFLKRLSTRPDFPARAPVVLQSIVYAAILILIMLFLPRGLLPGMIHSGRQLIARIRGTRTIGVPLDELADG